MSCRVGHVEFCVATLAAITAGYVPYCCIYEPLYAFITVLLGVRPPRAGNPFASNFVGYILLNMRSGIMFPCAPVSTFAFKVAGTCGLSSRVMSSIATISSRVTPPSLLTLSNERASNYSLSSVWM